MHYLWFKSCCFPPFPREVKLWSRSMKWSFKVSPWIKSFPGLVLFLGLLPKWVEQCLSWGAVSISWLINQSDGYTITDSVSYGLLFSSLVKCNLKRFARFNLCRNLLFIQNECRGHELYSLMAKSWRQITKHPPSLLFCYICPMTKPKSFHSYINDRHKRTNRQVTQGHVVPAPRTVRPQQE